MKIKPLLFSALIALCFYSLQAQEVLPLSLEEVVSRALRNSDAAKINGAQITQAEHALRINKDQQYPDIDLSAQYRYLTNADVNFKIPLNQNTADESSQTNTSSPKVNGLLLGSANVTMPLFSGFKLKKN